MRILIDITPYCDNTDSRDSMIQTLADVLSVAYNEEAADKEAYLAVDALDDTCAVFGMDNPEAILCAAQEWNKQIQADLRAAITEFTKTLGVFSAACNTRASLDTSATYNLKKAHWQRIMIFTPLPNMHYISPTPKMVRCTSAQYWRRRIYSVSRHFLKNMLSLKLKQNSDIK